MTSFPRLLRVLFVSVTLSALGLASEPGTPISTLPVTLTDSGYYYLTQDLTLDDGLGIWVQADNVIIDLCGYRMVGTDEAGPAITTFESFLRDLIVMNGEIEGWSTAIRADGPATVRDVSVLSCRDGLRLGPGSRVLRCDINSITFTAVDPGSGSSVLDCRVSNAAIGVSLGVGSVARRVYVTGAGTAFATQRGSVLQECTAGGFENFGVLGFNACRIENSTFFAYPNNEVGIGLDLEEGSRVSGTSVHLVPTGIVAERSCTILDTVVFDCDTGVDLGDGSSFVGGSVFRTDLMGILVRGRGVRIADTTVADNAGHGIGFQESGGLVERCIVSANGGDGLGLLHDSVARDNLLRDNQGTGIICAGDGNRLEGNTLHENGRGLVVAGRDNLLVGNRILDSTGPDLALAPKNPAGPFLTSTSWLTTAPALANFVTPLF